MDTDAMTDYYWENLKDILQRQLADDDEYHALIQKKITAGWSRSAAIRMTKQKFLWKVNA